MSWSATEVSAEGGSPRGWGWTRRPGRIGAAVAVGVVLLVLRVWLITDDRAIGWTGIVIGSPVLGPVEVHDDAGHVVARQNLAFPPLVPGQEQQFKVGPGHYEVVVCVGVPDFQHTYPVWVLPGFHTTVWNNPAAYASVFDAVCSH